MTEAEVIKFVTNEPFKKYDNYDAIEVPLVKNIPSDYEGMMGVPMSVFDKYSPEQFEIINMCSSAGGSATGTIIPNKYGMNIQR